MQIVLCELSIRTIKIFSTLSLDFPTKSLTIFSIWLLFLVDHRLEGVGVRLAFACKGLLRLPQRIYIFYFFRNTFGIWTNTSYNTFDYQFPKSVGGRLAFSCKGLSALVATREGGARLSIGCLHFCAL